MKLKIEIIAFILMALHLINPIFAGPIVSAGPMAHPAISTMHIDNSVAGIDFPTDAPAPQYDYVLSLYNGVRIPVYTDHAELVRAEAGTDYPTDIQAPYWTKFQRVLVLESKFRYPVRLTFDVNDNLLWKLTSGEVINVSEVVKIVKAEAGIDYPTDVPYFFNRDFYVAVMIDSTRIKL
ncbi:hypothetical protein [Halobacteriovorax sp. DA5]|uniref:hypothetical protein n=1 Tax=Halobacteriovorax sp. DA5 TaxID=2067553 RepID=UPI000CD1F9BE|nr:hypothetical protein [Halobacteriovorax sp. DA5]POB15282.1 hypothetical protein C0Z22_02530 [Halobacteriovorax sp. DA5]